MRHLLALAWLTLVFCLSSPAANAADEDPNKQCESCHADQVKKLLTSAHTSLGCTGCHDNHETYPHPANVPKPQCSACHAEQAGEHAKSVHGMALKSGNTAAPTCSVCHGDAHELKAATSPEFHKNVPDTCGMCHSDIAEQYKQSVHGQAVARGITSAPVCTSCHGEHSILSPKSAQSPVNPQHIRETSAQCHGDVKLTRKFGMPSDRIVSFDESFHGLAAKAGSQSVANCASCHGVHNILPSSDPKSMINSKNLPNTCGKCHPGAGQRFAMGSVHIVEGRAESNALKWVRIFYSIIIPLTIGFMLLHNGGDWIRKLWQRRLSPAARRFGSSFMPRHPRKAELRMFPLERAQHALLAVSFTVLVWTGFALKYPDQWWAIPLVRWERYWPVRGTVHRIAGVVMTAVGVFHLFTLLFNRKLRNHWKTLLFRRNDLPEAVGGFAYNMGLLQRRPRISPHSYIEKAEYWAVVWGTVVMFVTGVVLWANNWSLRFLPKSVIDLATSVHFYEAVLAALAILVWHFYSVIFDPDVYPMDTTWLTGKSVRQHEIEENEPNLERSELVEDTEDESTHR